MTMETAAIVYDFDGTLARGNLPEHGLFAHLGITDHGKFWADNKERAKKHDSDEILSYMKAILDQARLHNVALTRALLKEKAGAIPLFKGVESWFERINAFAEEDGFALEHYIISSGLLELLESSPIYHHFKKVFASSYEYEPDNGPACWPATGINYTTKTQYLFRINKGIHNSYDNSSINLWQQRSKRPVPFTRMIFIGDGDTDIPSMKMVRYQGGQAIAVYDPEKFVESSHQNRMKRLIADDRVDYVAPADYSEASQLEVTVRGILGRIRTKGEARRRHLD
jgi:hypothetical protein